MKTVFIFEDRPGIRSGIKELIKSRINKMSFNFVECFNVYQADAKWNKHKDNVNILILDLHISPDGLPADLTEKTSGGFLTGWVWLWNNAMKNDIDNYNATKPLILIYSAYTQELKDYLEKEADDGEKKFYKRISNTVFPKALEDAEEELIKCIQEYLNGPRKK